MLEKDSVRRFLRYFCQVGGSMGWGFIITSLTLTQMIKQNALKWAKVALEGKAPELSGFRANPNRMNRYGYFSLHQAAEMFSIDMVKLFFSYGASANIRTAGSEIIEDLLPLHVAVENTCLHKYLEENAFPNQEDLEDSQANLNYICRLIHLLCLPKMVPHNMKVPHEEVHERVSSILKDYGFSPTGEGISIGNLCRYADVLSKEESPYKHADVDAIKAAKETLCQNAEVEKAVKHKAPRGWELKYARRSFFPYWRSVLSSWLPVKVIRGIDIVVHQKSSWNKSVGQESSPTPDLNLGLSARVRQLSGRQPSRAFCSAALPLLKVLRNA